MIRVFVVDDSTFVRKAIVKVLHRDPELRVVGEAASGAEALRTIAGINPDVVTLDLAMPGLDGLQALRGLLAWRADLPVLMLSAHTHEGAAATLEALAIGAVDFVDKSAFSLLDLDSLGRQLVERIKLWGPGVSASREPRLRKPSPVPPPKVPAMLAECDLCVIGTSTGGPPALQYIFERLPAGFPMPVALVQHMPLGFTKPFADRLNTICRLAVREARDGDALMPGRVLVAPAGRHLMITADRSVALATEPANVAHTPSVDVLMRSAAQAWPGRVLGILLTGMGDDGAKGMAAIRAAGGVTLGESEASCVVYGMPRAARRIGAIEHERSLTEIAAWLATLGASMTAERR
ncbi:MAG: chemotaxis-specific protein-glutamate methyltransferase CheB [Gemmatimonadales bacterium]